MTTGPDNDRLVQEWLFYEPQKCAIHPDTTACRDGRCWKCVSEYGPTVRDTTENIVATYTTEECEPQ